MRIIVIGAGIIGLSIAYNLASQGADVVVVEAYYPGSGLSGRAIGGVHTQWDDESDIKLALASRETLTRLPSVLDFNIPFRRDGYLKLATSRNEMARLEKNAALQRSFGSATFVLSPQEIGARYPYLDLSSVEGGTFSAGDGVVYPFSLVYGYWSALERAGGKLLRHTTATRLRVESDRIHAIETDQGTLEGDVFLLAAGSATHRILGTAGFDVPTRLKKYEMFASEPLKFFLKPMIQLTPDGARLNQSLRGEIICDLPSPNGSTHTNTKASLTFLEEAARQVTRILPSLAAVKLLRPWAGVVEFAGDGKPIFGSMGYPNLWVAFADSGKGIMFAPRVGELLSDSIFNNELTAELQPYSPSRFAG
jgi:sarcosine oxidase subunit beta